MTNLSPIGDGNGHRFDHLDRGGWICQRDAVGLNAGKTVAGDVKADTSRRDTEPGIRLLGHDRGLAYVL